MAAAVGMTACDGAITEPGPDPAATLTVDATAGWTFVRLGSTAQPVTVTDPSASTGWDIAFNQSAVMLNGGGIGPAGVEAHCVCDNAGATPQQVLAMTPESELPDFEAVTAARIPASADAWRADTLAPVLTGWYSYDFATHTISPAPNRTWKVRLAARGADTAYAKLRVVGIEGATQQHAGRVTIEYAVQPSRGAALGTVQTRTLDVTNGGVAFDLVSGEPATDGAWDIRLNGYTMRLNGGVSGSGAAGAALATESFGDVTDAGDLVAQQYRTDRAGGVFSAQPWYLYNVAGDHQISPTFQVYLIRRGDEIYKVQLTGYYNEAGAPRHITFRYAPLSG